MSFRNLLIFFVFVSPIIQATENYVTKNTVENLSKLSVLKKNGKQIYFVYSEPNINTKTLNSKLISLTGVKTRVISERLVRIELDNAITAKEKIRAILELEQVERIYPNQHVQLKMLANQTTIVDTHRLSKSNKHLGLKAKQQNTTLKNDYYYPLQWGLENTGQGFMDSIGTEGSDIGAAEAWQLSTGLNDGVIAVFGERINPAHEDLENSFWKNELEIPNNGIDDDNNGYVDDIYGINANLDNGEATTDLLGINVYAGIISATQDNNIGISGIVKDKQLTCVMAETEGGVADMDDISECFSYIIDLKKNRGVNIHSVILDWAISAKTPNSFPWLRELVDSLIPYDIFVIAGVPKADWPFYHSDQYTSLPGGYDSSNILAVSSNDNKNIRNSGSSGGAAVGLRTIHTFAPGADIITTGTSYLASYTDEDSIFFDSFEQTNLDSWESVGDDFSSSRELSFSGGSSLKISKPMGESSTLTSSGMDLSGYKNKEVILSMRLYHSPDIEPTNGIHFIFYRLIYADGSEGGNRVLQLPIAPIWQSRLGYLTYEDFAADKTLEQLSNVKLQFEVPNNSALDTDVYIDDLAIAEKKSAETELNSYVLVHGAGAAAAHVAAGISLIKGSRPDLTNIQIKNLITSTGKSFEEYIGTGEFRQKAYFSMANKSFKVADNSTNSVLTCDNNQITRRIYPKLSGNGQLIATKGNPSKLSVLNIGCEEPAGAPEVERNGLPLELMDDGLHLDLEANDGVYTTDLGDLSLGDSNIRISNEEFGEFNLRTFSEYSAPQKIDFEWEVSNIENPDLTLSLSKEPPFIFNIGNVIDDHWDIENPISFRSINKQIIISYLSIDTITPYEPQNAQIRSEKSADKTSIVVSRLPKENMPHQILIAPYLSNLSSLAAGGIFDFTVGEAPNRKWVIEARGVQEGNCPDHPLLNYQTVFNESTGTIQFNYKKVGEICDGLLPGVGIQIGDQFNSIYMEPLEDEMSLKFSLAHNDYAYINQTPRRVQFIPVIRIKQSELFELELSDYIWDDQQQELSYELFLDQDAKESVDIEGIEINEGQLSIRSREIVSDIYYLKATDTEGLSVTIKFNLEIQGLPPTRLRYAGEHTIYQSVDSIINLDEYFSDEYDDSLSYSVDLDSDDYRIEGNLLILNIDETGEYRYSMTAMDSDNLTTVTTGNIINVVGNEAPTVSSNFNSFTFLTDQSIRIPLSQYFSDDYDSELTYSSNNLPSQLRIENAEIVGVFSNTGVYNFSVIAKDSQGLERVASTSLTVTKRAETSDDNSSSSGGGSMFYLLISLLLLTKLRKF